MPPPIADLLGVPLVGFARDAEIHTRAYMTVRERMAFETRLRAEPAYSYTTADVGGHPGAVRLCGVLRIDVVAVEVWEVDGAADGDLAAIAAAVGRASAGTPLLDASAAPEAAKEPIDKLIAVRVAGSKASVIMARRGDRIETIAVGLAADFPKADPRWPSPQPGAFWADARITNAALQAGRIAIRPEAAEVRQALATWDGSAAHPSTPLVRAFVYGVAHMLRAGAS